jgi:hypothetical protein
MQTINLLNKEDGSIWETIQISSSVWNRMNKLAKHYGVPVEGLCLQAIDEGLAKLREKGGSK